MPSWLLELASMLGVPLIGYLLLRGEFLRELERRKFLKESEAEARDAVSGASVYPTATVTIGGTVVTGTGQGIWNVPVNAFGNLGSLSGVHVATIMNLPVSAYEYIPTAPDLPEATITEPIVGWRAWSVLGSMGDGEGTQSTTNEPWFYPLILSMHSGHTWVPGKAAIAMDREDNPIGTNLYRYHREHTAHGGIYGLAHEGQIGQQLTDWDLYDDEQVGLYVYGEVSMWGTVIRHEHGYRSEFAYPKRLIVPRRFGKLGDIPGALRRTYGCEAEWESKPVNGE